MDFKTGECIQVIPIKNIYYMLAYAFQVLQSQGYKSLAAENFENTADLCAAILCKGVSNQLKQGLGRNYIPQTEPLSTVRGKIDLAESIRSQTVLKQQLVCSYDDFSVDTKLNRIIKSTLLLLTKNDISRERKKEIRKLLVFFGEINEIDLYNVDWHIQYDRNNQTYRMMIAICNLIVRGLLQKQEDGTLRMMDYLDEQRMCHLYEKFILNYYKREHPDINSTASQIDWQLDDGVDDLLPVMKTDITLSSKDGKRFLIIDAKYYTHMMQVQYDKHTLHSGNLYQIFTYVKNKEFELRAVESHTVSGMLLYARTDEEISPDGTYHMSGNQIGVKSLDLNVEFDQIQEQLDRIYDDFFCNTEASWIIR